MSESVHQAAMWEHAGDGNYERAAVHALRLGDLVAVRSTEGGRLVTGQAQVFATLALAQAKADEAVVERLRRWATSGAIAARATGSDRERIYLDALAILERGGL